MSFEGGRKPFRRCNSNIPIKGIRNIVKKYYDYISCGVGYGKSSANITFNFKKERFIPQTLWETIIGKQRIESVSIDFEFLDQEISKYLENYHREIYYTRKGNQFCFKEMPKELQKVKKIVEHF